MVRENIKSNYQFSSHSHLGNKIQGRLLSIVARQAIMMKNPTQKIFLDALNKVNPEALHKARHEI